MRSDFIFKFCFLGHAVFQNSSVIVDDSFPTTLSWLGWVRPLVVSSTTECFSFVMFPCFITIFCFMLSTLHPPILLGFCKGSNSWVWSAWVFGFRPSWLKTGLWEGWSGAWCRWTGAWGCWVIFWVTRFAWVFRLTSFWWGRNLSGVYFPCSGTFRFSWQVCPWVLGLIPRTSGSSRWSIWWLLIGIRVSFSSRRIPFRGSLGWWVGRSFVLIKWQPFCFNPGAFSFRFRARWSWCTWWLFLFLRFLVSKTRFLTFLNEPFSSSYES